MRRSGVMLNRRLREKRFWSNRYAGKRFWSIAMRVREKRSVGSTSYNLTPPDTRAWLARARTRGRHGAAYWRSNQVYFRNEHCCTQTVTSGCPGVCVPRGLRCNWWHGLFQPQHAALGGGCNLSATRGREHRGCLSIKRPPASSAPN